MTQSNTITRFVLLLAAAPIIASCAATPWKIAAVTLKRNPGPCSAVTGFQQMDNITTYVYSGAVEAGTTACAIAEVTVVPTGNAKPGPNIFLYTSFDEKFSDGALRMVIADYQLLAPKVDPSHQTFDVIAALSQIDYKAFASDGESLRLYLGNNVDVAETVCTVSLNAGQINC